MDNPEKLGTRGTRDTGRRHTKQKTQWIMPLHFSLTFNNLPCGISEDRFREADT
jgi:membrane protein insertase Oxa1/YidC/SpoIIIJ